MQTYETSIQFTMNLFQSFLKYFDFINCISKTSEISVGLVKGISLLYKLYPKSSDFLFTFNVGNFVLLVVSICFPSLSTIMSLGRNTPFLPIFLKRRLSTLNAMIYNCIIAVLSTSNYKISFNTYLNSIITG